MVEIFVHFLYLYIAAGALFAVLFLRRGAARIDETAQGISWPTRLLLFPGCVALWPVLWKIWRKAQITPNS